MTLEHDDRKLSTQDEFELISAYIDGELSPEERNRVQRLLDRNGEVKRIYTQLLALQGKMQSSVAPPSNKSVAEISSGVFQSLERRRQRKFIWGGSALAASLVAAIGLLPGTPDFRMAARQESPIVRSNAVMLSVALDKPAIDIPKGVNSLGFESPLAQ